MVDQSAKYAEFKTLLDEPNANPVLGFDDYAAALAELITKSKPRFSIGIFGSWGSGKTSLMRAIQRNLQPKGRNPDLVTVWFNPWRYEKEEHLIVPLLDTLRESLVEWSARKPKAVVDRATKAASTVGRAARAILAGVTIKAAIPGAEASLDAGKILGEWRQPSPEDAAYAREPQSFYHASFTAMQGALKDFFKHDVSRVVVFIDDLDRCLPVNALQVLESMKLFFDLDGFVFVVGLDQAVIERAIAIKYHTVPRPRGLQEISATEYVKKIFQVPFAVPPIRSESLNDYLGSLDLTGDQNADLIAVVRRHLLFIAQQQTLNPREVKRFINAYTLQLKLLSRRLKNQAVDHHAVLAVQAMNFRSDWADLYKELVSDPTAFSANLASALQQGYWPARRRLPFPPSFVNYTQGPGAVLTTANLHDYVASVQATTSSDSLVLDMTQAIREAWQAWAPAADGAPIIGVATAVGTALGKLTSLATSAQGGFGTVLMRNTQDLQRLLTQLQEPNITEPQVTAGRRRFEEVLESLELALDERRRTTSVGGTT